MKTNLLFSNFDVKGTEGAGHELSQREDDNSIRAPDVTVVMQLTLTMIARLRTVLINTAQFSLREILSH